MRKLTSPSQVLVLEENLPALERYFRELGSVVAVYLYGSHNTPKQTPLSDIDLAVIAFGSIDTLDLVGGIMERIGDDVSVSILNQASLPFRFRVLSTGKLLFVFDEARLADFIEQSLKRYHDFRLDYEAMLRDYDQALQEDYGH